MKKYIYIMVVALAAIVTACDNDFAYPPVIMGDIKGDGSQEAPFNIAAAVRQAGANGETSDVFFFVGGYVVSGSIDTSFGNATWDLYDNADGSGQKLIAYRVKGYDNKRFTSDTEVKIGDYVVLYTPLINFRGNTPETGSGGYLYSVNGNVGSTIVVPDQPDQPQGNVIYTGLTSNMDGWTIDNVVIPSDLTYVWQWDASYKCLKASAFANSKNHATDAYATTTVDLSGYTSAAATFEHVFRYGADTQKSLTFVAREQGATQWTTLTIPGWATGENWTFVSSGTVDLKAFAGKKVELGFRYTSTDTAAATWEIKNLNISASK